MKILGAWVGSLRLNEEQDPPQDLRAKLEAEIADAHPGCETCKALREELINARLVAIEAMDRYLELRRGGVESRHAPNASRS